MCRRNIWIRIGDRFPLDDYFPDTRAWREGEFIVCEIEDHLYTKYWEHKFSAYTFADAMERAVRRLAYEGLPLAKILSTSVFNRIGVALRKRIAIAADHDKRPLAPRRSNLSPLPISSQTSP